MYTTTVRRGFRAGVALKALRGYGTIREKEIATRHRVHPNQVSVRRQRTDEGGVHKGTDTNTYGSSTAENFCAHSHQCLRRALAVPSGNPLAAGLVSARS